MLLAKYVFILLSLVVINPFFIYWAIRRFGLFKQKARKYRLTYTLNTHEVQLNMIEMNSIKKKNSTDQQRLNGDANHLLETTDVDNKKVKDNGFV